MYLMVLKTKMTNSNAQKDARCHFENSLWHDGRGISIVQAFVRLRTFRIFSTEIHRGSPPAH